MRFELTSRHLDITPALRRLVNTKLAKLERLLNDSAVSARAVLTREKYRLQADITLHARGEKFLHGIGSSAAWETSVEQAVDKIAQQAAKVKGKWQERKRRGGRRGASAGEPIESAATGGAPASAGRARPATSGGRPERVEVRPRMPRVFRSSRVAVRSMSVAEAVRTIDARSDDLVVFRDAERSSISVLYRRNGELTLVETTGD
jgi:putative sigma-54 modulation protein